MKKIKVEYKLGMINNEWSGMRATLWINGLVFMLLPIAVIPWIIFTRSGTVDWFMGGFFFILGLTCLLATGVHIKWSA